MPKKNLWKELRLESTDDAQFGQHLATSVVIRQYSQVLQNELEPQKIEFYYREDGQIFRRLSVISLVEGQLTVQDDQGWMKGSVTLLPDAILFITSTGNVRYNLLPRGQDNIFYEEEE